MSRDFVTEKNRLWNRMKEIDAATDGKRALTSEEQTNWDTANADMDTLIDAEARETKLGTLSDYMSKSANPALTRAIATASVEDDKNRKEPTKEERKKFDEWLRYGTVDGRSVRALQSDSDVAGGFTVPLQVFQNEIIQQVQDIVYVYGKSRNFTVDRAESLGAPVLQTQLGLPTWGTELSVGTADTTMTFGKRELRPHPMVGEILVSKKLLRQSGIDVEALVRDQIAYKMGVLLEQALLNGNGVSRPLGIFSTDANNPISSGTDVTSASSGVGFASTDADNLIAAKYNLKQQYWANAVWIMNRGHAGQIRSMKDANNQYIWLPGGGFSAAVASGAEPAFDSILGRPLLMSEYAPLSSGTAVTTWSTSGQTLLREGSTGPLSGYVAAIGDLSQIWTVQALSLQIQHLVELKAETNQDAFIYRMEADGMPVLGEAFARIRSKGF